VISDVVEAGGQGMDDPDRSPVGDHQDFLAGMELQDICKEVIHAGGEVLERLSIIRPGTLAGEPAPMRVGEALLDLLHGQSFPRAEASLAQPRIDSNLEAQPLRDYVRSLARPRQVARIDHVDVSVELVGEQTGLFATQLVEARIGTALPAPVSVPVGLAVSNQ
jgi:hypothetical protein